MDYNLEQLNGNTFQKLVQSLASSEYRDIVCYPLGEPDGGRDIRLNIFTDQEKWVGVQVKFTSSPDDITDAAEWLKGTIKDEKDKIHNLKERGMAEYVLATNVKGSAYLDSGERDRLNQYIEEKLDIPFQCWWRNEIERKLDTSSDVKWSYPEILSGQDVLQMLVLDRAKDNGLRHDTALRAYIKKKYKDNRLIKFRQVDLTAEIGELYIDVPVFLETKSSNNDDGDSSFAGNIPHTIFRKLRKTRRNKPFSSEKSIGAVGFFTNRFIEEGADKFVLEGAPGQGKSTVVQYLSQLHRQEFLKNENLIGRSFLEDTTSRIPFEIELRDYAQWLREDSPFRSEHENVDWNPSIESFLAAQISHYSGGAQFTVDDLHAVFSVSNVLLVFDGLDEVADIELRKRVVEEIQAGVIRLEELAESLLTIVTSRPAAFSNSPGMPRSDFAYLHLDSVSRKLIEDYAQSWMEVRGLTKTEKTRMEKMLDEKLEQPHLRDLAKNPMQLAILLTLVYMRGSSLPDKRTELYDKYIEHFLDRESEKSVRIKENRDLIRDLHGYIAWILHASTGRGDRSGRLTVKELKSSIREYLEHNGYDVSLLDDIFKGMVQRVVALVSRVEGTYEFEVQPLREYFAARYLYDSAPYSPPGRPRSGTTPERFEAIAQNFFWLNVTRFFAGCLDRGELPALVYKLHSIREDDKFKNTTYPLKLNSDLLSDRVFKQKPDLKQEILDITTSKENLTFFVKVHSGVPYGRDYIELPDGAGKEALTVSCFDLLKEIPNRDFAVSLLSIIKSNRSSEYYKKEWIDSITEFEGYELAVWLNYGRRLNVLSSLSNDEISAILSRNTIDESIRKVLFVSDKSSLLVEDDKLKEDVIEDILCYESPLLNYEPANSLDILSTSHDIRRYIHILNCDSDVNPLALFEWLSQERDYLYTPNPQNLERRNEEYLDKIISVYEEVYERFKEDISVWRSSVTPWNDIIEYSRKKFGTQLTHLGIATIGAGIRSRSETCADASDLLDTSLPLVSRARYARLRAGNPKWWSETFNQADDETQIALCVLVCSCWASTSTLCEVSVEMSQALSSLSQNSWSRVHALAKRISDALRGDNYAARDPITDADDIDINSPRLAALLCAALNDSSSAQQLFDQSLSKYEGDDQVVLSVTQLLATERLAEEPDTWSRMLGSIKHAYQNGVSSGRLGYIYNDNLRDESEIPLECAKEVTKNFDKYPSGIVSPMESVMRAYAGENTKSVIEIASEEGWIDNVIFGKE